MARSRDRYSDYYSGWAPYVPVAERRKAAEKKVAALKKKGKTLNPVQIEGRSIAQTFWGKAWCENLETYSDYSNRLPRGRTYVRNGSVIDLQMSPGKIEAMVNGSSIYTVKITIPPMERSRWESMIRRCSGQVDSLVALLQGKFSKGVMEVVTCKEDGMFPDSVDISMSCSCPDGAVMCKHVAAVLYGVGARLDQQPELFFQLRNVDHTELLTVVKATAVITRTKKSSKILKSSDLSGIFGIDIEPATVVAKAKKGRLKK